MVWQWTAYAAPLFAATLICLVVAWLGLRSRGPGKAAFAVLAAAVALWTGTYALELCSPTLAQKVLWAKAEYFGIVTVPVAWLIFSLQYAGWVARPGYALPGALMAVPVTTVALVFHPTGVAWIWRTVQMVDRSGLSVLRHTYGPWFWVHTVYSYSIFALAAGVLMRTMFRSPHLYRKQGLAVGLAVFLPWFLSMVYVSGHNPLPLDPTPFGFVVTGVAMLWSLTRQQFLDLMPVARATAIESMRDGIVVLDGDERIVDLNPAAVEIIGEPAAAVIGRHFDSAFSGRIELREWTSKDNEFQLEAVLTTGALPRHYELRSWPLGGGRGVAPGRLVAFRDISEQKETENALRESEERLRVLIEQVPAVLWSTDSGLRFTQMVGAALQQLGVSAESVVGTEIFDFFGTIDNTHPAVAAHMKALEGLPSTYAMEWFGRDFECHVEPLLDRRGVPCGIVGVGLDVTETQDLQEQLRQSQKMEAIGRMAGGVAHDFNNLLTAVTGYAQLALEDLDSIGVKSVATRNLRRDLDAIQHASERATSITAQLLAFSRRQVLNPRVLSINEIVEDMEKMVRRLIGPNVELLMFLDPEAHFIKADPGQIQQVVINLALNSRDAMPEGGRITLETANVDVSERRSVRYDVLQPGGYVLMTVSDDGFGMDERTQLHIFEPFFTTKEEGKGTGLGLSTVYGIVKQAEGFIEVDSAVGMGTEFKIYFPAVIDEQLELPEVPGEPTERRLRGAETVLLVEDDEMVRGLGTRILSSHGYLVLEAEGGEEALEVCRRHEGTIHLMVTDVVMPGMNGRELAERMGAIAPGMAVLYTSGYTGGALIEHGVLRDGTNFLQKPFSPRNLVQRVREVLDRHAATL